MSATAPILSVDRVCLDLDGKRILSQISFEIQSGEFLGVIGPNGGGKTTLLRLLAGLLPVSSGHIRWGASPTSKPPSIGYVPQKLLVDSHFPLSCEAIVRQGIPGSTPLWGARRREIDPWVATWIQRVQLTSHVNTRAADLSGGQQRRMLLARAMMSKPSILLLDEPTAGVDSQGQDQFCQILRELCQAGMTVVMVSHDIPLVTEHAHRIACVGVTLHWHGTARELRPDIVENAYRCELERYRTSHHHAEVESEPITFHSKPPARRL